MSSDHRSSGLFLVTGFASVQAQRTLAAPLAMWLVLQLPASAATIVVDGQTTDPPGTCDLVEAIENANDDFATNPDCTAGSPSKPICRKKNLQQHASRGG